MRSGVHHSPERHLIRNLPVEPDVFVCGESPCQFGTNNSDDIPEHGEQNEATIIRKYKTSTTRNPDGVFQRVQTRKFLVDSLRSKDGKRPCQGQSIEL